MLYIVLINYFFYFSNLCSLLEMYPKYRTPLNYRQASYQRDDTVEQIIITKIIQSPLRVRVCLVNHLMQVSMTKQNAMEPILNLQIGNAY